MCGEPRRLYSDRTEHFCGRGAQILTKLLGVGSDTEIFISSHPEPSMVIRVYQKCQKTKKCEKPGFWGIFSNSSKTVKSIVLIFWHKRPLTNTKRLGGKIFLKTCFIFEKTLVLQKVKFLKNPFFDFHKIQNLSTHRPKVSALWSSASRSDLFGQGEQFCQNFCIFSRKEVLNQKIALRK